MSRIFYSVDLRSRHDAIKARVRGRRIAGALGFEPREQERMAANIFDLASYTAGQGRVEIEISTGGSPVLLIALKGVRNDTAGGDSWNEAISNAKKTFDELQVECEAEATRVSMSKRLPAGKALDQEWLRIVQAEVAQEHTPDPLEELQRQNQELIATLNELHRRQQEITQLNRELEETNRGVVALYAELDERADYLRKASELKSSFLSNMTHEFRTPLNSILSLSRLLLDRVDGDLNSEQEKQVEFIRKAAKDLSELVNDLLDLAKVEAGKEVVRVSTLMVEDLFSILRGTTKPLLPQDGALALTFEEVGPLPPIQTDERKLSQILRNFISNAIKYTERGEITVSAALLPPREIRFSVRDTGIGIPPGEQEKVFEEFYQVDNTLQRRHRGTGLGLPLARRLAELLGGRVSLHSEPGFGSTFSVVLPLEYQSSSQPAGAVENRKRQEPEGARAAVLIVDDDEISRYLLKGMLGEHAVSVVEASGGRAGLALTREIKPALIFLDLVMPELSGFEVLEALKADAQTKHIPVVICTSKTLTKEEEKRVRTSALAVLSKDEGERENTRLQIRRIINQTMSKPD